jgi:glycosyltransferase involved in cell wall biosynthesis
MTPTVSITLCCYNSEPFLEATLESIVAQTYRNWELVIVNDGSRDATEEIVKRYVAQGWPITYHYQPNAGLGAARNKALELSRGKFVALIDHDDLWTADKLERQLPLFAKPQVGLVYSGAEVVGLDGRVLRSYMPPERMYRGKVLNELFLADFLACSTAVLRRSAIDEVGAFRPELTITEEYELWFRIAEKFEFDYIEEPLMKWRLHSSNATWNSRKVRDESTLVLREVLARHPEIEKWLGSRVIRMRLAGFSCTRQQAVLLGDFRRAIAEMRRVGAGKVIREVARPLLKYVVSLLPTSMIDVSQRVVAMARRRAATS